MRAQRTSAEDARYPAADSAWATVRSRARSRAPTCRYERFGELVSIVVMRGQSLQGRTAITACIVSDILNRWRRAASWIASTNWDLAPA